MTKYSHDVSRAELARVFGVRPAAIQRLERAGMPVGRRGRKVVYKLPTCVQWYVSHKIAAAELEIPPRCSVRQFAQQIDVSTRQVERFIGEGLPSIVEARSRSIMFTEAIQWHVQRKVRAASQIELSALDQVRLRKMDLLNQFGEMELAKLRGAVVTRDDVEQLITQLRVALTQVIERFPELWAQELVGIASVLDLRQRVKRLVYVGLAELGKAAVAVAERFVSESERMAAHSLGEAQHSGVDSR